MIEIFKNYLDYIIPSLGYLASLLILVTFYMSGEVKIRKVAMGSNVIGIVYSFLAYTNGMNAILPILILHSLLLPMNFWRIRKLKIDDNIRVKNVEINESQNLIKVLQ